VERLGQHSRKTIGNVYGGDPMTKFGSAVATLTEATRPLSSAVELGKTNLHSQVVAYRSTCTFDVHYSLKDQCIRYPGPYCFGRAGISSSDWRSEALFLGA